MKYLLICFLMLQAQAPSEHNPSSNISLNDSNSVITSSNISPITSISVTPPNAMSPTQFKVTDKAFCETLLDSQLYSPNKQHNPSIETVLNHFIFSNTEHNNINAKKDCNDDDSQEKVQTDRLIEIANSITQENDDSKENLAVTSNILDPNAILQPIIEEVFDYPTNSLNTINHSTIHSFYVFDENSTEHLQTMTKMRSEYTINDTKNSFPVCKETYYWHYKFTHHKYFFNQSDQVHHSLQNEHQTDIQQRIQTIDPSPFNHESPMSIDSQDYHCSGTQAYLYTIRTFKKSYIRSIPSFLQTAPAAGSVDSNQTNPMYSNTTR